MDQYRRLAPLEERPDGFFENGHFWLQEFLLGGVVQMRMEPSGLLTFGGPTDTVDPEAAWPYRRGIEAVRSAFDRDAFRNRVEDVSAYEFSLLTPLGMGFTYEWEQVPPIFGLDVWDATIEDFASVDITERVFEAVGIETVPTVDREVPARELSASSLSMPSARYGDGPAAGVVIQKKRGEAVLARRPDYSDHSRAPPAPAGSPSDLADWMTETVDGGLLESYGLDRSMNQAPLEEFVDAVAAELARRRFASVGKSAMKNPETFHTTVHDRLLTLRTPGPS